MNEINLLNPELKKIELQVCSRCIMDTSDSDISFDEDGVCVHCLSYEERAKNELYPGELGKKKLDEMVSRIKAAGKNKDYDCIIGLSGGTDSTMVAYHVKRLGLRPLAVHLDNGWNSELAVSNVEKTVKTLNLDLYTLVLDWEQFRDLHLSFLKASVANSEIPTDHAIVATLYKLAVQKGVQYIITGSNLVTEATMPRSWGYDATDWRHIQAIQKRFGSAKLKQFPHMTLFDWVYYTFLKQIKFIPILNCLDYKKEEAKKMLADEIGWKDYGGKHFESIYTRFFQSYILPKKFNIDKRKGHFSTLICSGQMTRDEALAEMKKQPYPDDLMEQDKVFVIKKFGITADEFDSIMQDPVKSFADYPNNDYWFKKFRVVVQYAKKRATEN